MDNELQRIFFPQLREEFYRLHYKEIQLAHYTSGEAVLKILRSKRMWMRSTTVMNDISEVRHGINLVKKFLDQGAGEPLFRCLDRLHEGTTQQLVQLFDDWSYDLETNTYIACLSEHDDKRSPEGLLSMWRAYGSRNGAALIFNPAALIDGAESYNASVFPVFYQTDQGAESMFEWFSQRVVMAENLLEQITERDLLGYCFNALQTFALTLKHPAFEEEKEWRIIYRPFGSPSSRMNPISTVIGSTPQNIYELPIHEEPTVTPNAPVLDNMLERIIIGPSEFPEVMAATFITELGKTMSQSEVDQLVRTSDIPLRLNG